uniref:Uncharacterized protein n=1 Tax=Manihot esculenta TaxID=3983 RepID=A0A2C9UW64_MANES
MHGQDKWWQWMPEKKRKTLYNRIPHPLLGPRREPPNAEEMPAEGRKTHGTH